MSRILGIDIGNVIIEGRGPDDTSFFSDKFLSTPSVADAFYAIARLVPLFGDTHLVSKCGENVQRKSRLWLEHHDFYKKTGVTPGNVHFCVDRAGKAPICERLGVTHFIDDKLEVLGYLKSVKNLYLFRPRDNEVKRHAEHLPRVTKRVESWAELADLIDDGRAK